MDDAASDALDDVDERERLLFDERLGVRSVGRKNFRIAEDDVIVLPRGKT